MFERVRKRENEREKNIRERQRQREIKDAELKTKQFFGKTYFIVV